MNAEMKCRDIRQGLAEQTAGTPLSPRLQEHVDSCSQCRRLAEVLNKPPDAPEPSLIVTNRVAEAMAADLRPVRPLASPSIYAMILGGILLCAFGLAVYSMRPYGWEEMGALETAIVLAALTICAASCVRSLVKQMTPAARYQLRPELLPPIVVGVLAIGVAALFHFEREEEFWASTWICLKIGLQIALPTAVLVWLVVRMGLILSPGVTGGTVGVVAGLAAAGALEVHCPNVDAWHILASHLGVAVCAGLLGFIPGLAAKFRGPYRRLAAR